MSEFEFGGLRELRRDHRRLQPLAERITGSIGQRPRPLPSRTRLAIESESKRLGVVASMLVVLLLAIGELAGEVPTASHTSVLSSVLEGRGTPAQDVYAELTGLGSHAGTGR